MTINTASSFSEKGTLIIPINPTQSPSLAKHPNLKEGFSNLAFEGFSGEKNETRWLYPSNSNFKVLLVGLGGQTNFSNLLGVFQKVRFQNKDNWTENITVDFSWTQHLSSKEIKLWADAITNGLLVGTYDIGLYKTKPASSQKSPSPTLTFIGSDVEAKALKKGFKLGQNIGLTQLSILDLVNAPGNKTTPQEMARWAQAAGKEGNFSVEIHSKAAIEKMGLHALLAVNRGSEYPPEFIVMTYEGPDSADRPSVGLIGKGVTFDTGGYSIKGSSNMHYMKSDMGGAAAVLGTMLAVSKAKLPIRLIGIVPTTDNMVDALAIRPGDVINSYAGKTIEIIDTDAEGRLILADGINYMVKKHKPDIMIDLATLTGSSVRALGYHAGALFCNDDSLLAELFQTGLDTGEKLWPLPLWDEYEEDIHSDVADVKNFSGKPIAGAISAAKFLEFFTEKHPKWAHMDIAGVAFGNSGLSKEKSATAFGIRLLTTFMKNLK